MPSSGQHAFVESASSKIAVSSKNCNAFFHIGITSLRINCAGVGGLTTKVTVSLCSSLAYCVELCQRSESHPAAFSHTLAGWPLFTPMKNTTTYYNNSYPAALAPGAHLSTASRSPSPFQGRRRLSATCDITCNKMASLKGSNCPGDSSIQ